MKDQFRIHEYIEKIIKIKNKLELIKTIVKDWGFL
jgi:hypothetical protein